MHTGIIKHIHTYEVNKLQYFLNDRKIPPQVVFFLHSKIFQVVCVIFREFKLLVNLKVRYYGTSKS